MNIICEVSSLQNTLLEQIEQAERQAEEIQKQAQREAREILKSVEEANIQMERQALRDMHDAAARRLEEARISTQDEIKALELRREGEREALKRTAQARVSQAGRTVFERVVGNGNR